MAIPRIAVILIVTGSLLLVGLQLFLWESRELPGQASWRPWSFGSFGSSGRMRDPVQTVDADYLLGVGKADITGYGIDYSILRVCSR